MSRLFSVIDANDCHNAHDVALRAASELASKGISILILESSGANGTSCNIRTLSELKSHMKSFDADSLRGYLACGSVRMGRMAIDKCALASDDMTRLCAAYDIIITAQRSRDLLRTADNFFYEIMPKGAHIPALMVVRASGDHDVAYAGKQIRKIIELEGAPRLVAFTIIPHDLAIASSLSRRWQIPSWGDFGNGMRLAERILSRAISLMPFPEQKLSDEDKQDDHKSQHIVRQALKILREDSDFKEMEKSSRGTDGRINEMAQRKRVARSARRIVAQLCSGHSAEEIVARVVDEACGFGPIEHLLIEPDITEIMVCGPKNIYIEQNGKIERVANSFYDDDHLMAVMERMLMPTGRRIDEATPFADARLADGSRVHAIIPPLAIDGPHLTVRRFLRTINNMKDALGASMMPVKVADFLSSCVRSRISIVVSGGTGSGKTTLLNVLASEIDECERIITIEDAAELRLSLPHVVRLESRPANVEGIGQITIRDLVRNALRMRPDRIIVGECRGAEALDMLQAMNTGHEGSLTTVHANSPRDALARLETMVLMADLALPLRAIREQIARAVDLIIQVSRHGSGARKIVEIAEVTGMEGEVISMQTIAQRGEDGILEMTGLMPHFNMR